MTLTAVSVGQEKESYASNALSYMSGKLSCGVSESGVMEGVGKCKVVLPTFKREELERTISGVKAPQFRAASKNTHHFPRPLPGTHDKN